MNQELIYSEERGTWNLFVNGEWYYEGTYEQCEEMMFNNAAVTTNTAEVISLNPYRVIEEDRKELF